MKYLIVFLWFVSTWTAVKAQDMANFFVRMPDEYIFSLESEWRKDLVELYKAGKPAALDNVMQGRSVLLKLTADYLLLQSTERSTVEMKFLPLINNTYITCVVTTVHAPVADSRVAFFTTDWQPLNAVELWKPAVSGQFVRTDVDVRDEAYAEALSLLDLLLVHYRLSADDATLTAEYTTPAYLNAEEREKVKPFLKAAPMIYRWQTGRFVFEPAEP
ncbi:MAG: DUF3256 family protein [Tannerella sp.]|jgi:hypothetical protein|nr:DUF3256 family protein [Tannerella sp.]